MGVKTCQGMHEDLITTLTCIYHIKLYQWQGRDCSNEDIKITSTLLDKAKYITKYRVVAALSASWWIYRNSELTNSRINDKTKYRFKVQIWRQNEHSICTAKGIGWTWCSNLGAKVCEVSNTKRGQSTKSRPLGSGCAEGTDWSKGQGRGGHRGVGRCLERGWFVWVYEPFEWLCYFVNVERAIYQVLALSIYDRWACCTCHVMQVVYIL